MGLDPRSRPSLGRIEPPLKMGAMFNGPTPSASDGAVFNSARNGMRAGPCARERASCPLCIELQQPLPISTDFDRLPGPGPERRGARFPVPRAAS